MTQLRDALPNLSICYLEALVVGRCKLNWIGHVGGDVRVNLLSNSDRVICLGILFYSLELEAELRFNFRVQLSE